MKTLLIFLLTGALAMAGAPIKDARISGASTVSGAFTATGGSTIDLSAAGTLLLPAGSVFAGDTGTGGGMGLVPAPAPGDGPAGKVLGAGGEWVLAASSLETLQDATITSPALGQLLQYDGAKWINGPPPVANLADLGDVITTSPANGDVLTFSGSEWIPVPGGGSGGGGIIDPTINKGDLVVRNATTIGRLPVGADGEVLVADSTAAEGLRWRGKYGAAVYSETDWTIARQTQTKVTLDLIEFDTDGMVDPLDPSFITVPADGYYYVSGTVSFPVFGSGNTSRTLNVSVNGSNRITGTGWAGPNQAVYVTAAEILPLAQGDVVELYAWHNASGSINLYVPTNKRAPRLTVVRIF